MKKSIITLAVAAAMTAPVAAMADAVMYGKLNMSLDYFDVEGGLEGWTVNGRNGAGDGRANRLGVKGSEDLGGGLKAIYQIEFGVRMANEADNDANNGDADSAVTMRNSFVGLSSGFGTVLIGRHDTPHKLSTGKLDLFSDTIADYNQAVGFDDVRADSAIAYISPNFSGFNISAAVIPGGAMTFSGAKNLEADSVAESYSLAAAYSNGPFYAGLGYEAISDDHLPDTDDYTKWRLGLGMLNWNGFTLAGVYEQQDFGDLDGDAWQISAGYKFGNNMVKGMYGQYDLDTDADDEGDQESWAIGFDHNFSKRTTAYLIYTDVDADGDEDAGDWSAFSLGMIHSF